MATEGIPRKALQAVIDYLWDDERVNYGGDPQDDHIFLSVLAVDNWLHHRNRTPGDFAEEAD